MTPSRTVTAASLVAAGVLILAGMLATPWEPEATTRSFIETIGENAAQGQIAAVLLYGGFLALVPASFGLLAVLRDHPGKLRTIGGVLAVVGCATLPGLLVVDFYAIAMFEELTLEQAVRVEEAAAGMPGAGVIGMLGGLPSMIGTSLLFTAVWRAGLVRGWVPLVLLLGWIGPMAGVPALGISSGVGILVAGTAVARAIRARESGVRRTEIEPATA